MARVAYLLLTLRALRVDGAGAGCAGVTARPGSAASAPAPAPAPLTPLAEAAALPCGWPRPVKLLMPCQPPSHLSRRECDGWWCSGINR
jgi:hypothetical protein